MSVKIAFKAIVILYLAYFGWQIVSARDFFQFSEVSYLKHVDIVFHEAGHTLFALFGDIVYTLAGSFFQVLVPAFFAGYFLFYRKELFSAGILLFWTAESMTDAAFYIADAQKTIIPLLGNQDGGAQGHDWNHLFTLFGILEKTDAIAGIAFFFSWLVFAGAFITMSYSLYREMKSKD